MNNRIVMIGNPAPIPDMTPTPGTMRGMPIRAEVQRRTGHLGRSMKAGLSPLWVIITAAVAVVGGSTLLAALWGVKHLIWGLIILLVSGFAVLAEGSYRLFRGDGMKHAEQVKKLKRERDTARTELEGARRELGEAQAASPGQVDLERLAEDCDRLSRQINEYRGERTRGQPGHRFPTAKTQDGQHKQWVNTQAENEQYRNETTAIFQQRFATDLSVLWHAANEAGLVGEDDFRHERMYFEFGVINEPSMGPTAVVLAELGRRAKARRWTPR